MVQVFVSLQMYFNNGIEGAFLHEAQAIF